MLQTQYQVGDKVVALFGGVWWLGVIRKVVVADHTYEVEFGDATNTTTVDFSQIRLQLPIPLTRNQLQHGAQFLYVDNKPGTQKCFVGVAIPYSQGTSELITWNDQLPKMCIVAML